MQEPERQAAAARQAAREMRPIPGPAFGAAFGLGWIRRKPGRRRSTDDAHRRLALHAGSQQDEGAMSTDSSCGGAPSHARAATWFVGVELVLAAAELRLARAATVRVAADADGPRPRATVSKCRGAVGERSPSCVTTPVPWTTTTHPPGPRAAGGFSRAACVDPVEALAGLRSLPPSVVPDARQLVSVGRPRTASRGPTA
jgi:hypothetical protein